jgi:Calcineurin-like phosphoesterase
MNIIFRLGGFCGILWTLSGFALAAPIKNDAALWRPRFATPAIVALDSASNRQFVAEVRASAAAAKWSVTLSNDLRAWKCDVVSSVYGKINRDTERGWRVVARVPVDISPELCSVVISSSEAVSVQPQAVSIAPSFSTDFYILHISDEQIVNEKHTDPSGQYYKMVGTWEEIKWMQEPVNLINPRVVIITGDQIDYNGALDAWNNWANWGYKPHGKKTFSSEETLAIQHRLIAMYKDCHKGYRVPYAEAPGNHDVPPVDKPLAGSKILWHPVAAPIYESAFGQRTYSFRMGDFYVLMHDWTERSLRNWAQVDYAAALNDPAVKFRLIGQHFNADQAFCPDQCDLMLVGHGHTCKTLNAAPYYIYEDGPAFKYGTAGFFNFRRQTNGWTCDQTVQPRSLTRDTWPLFTDNGALKKVRANRPDPMNISDREVTITNDLPQTFYDGRVRFVLPKGQYHAVNGAILSQYECDRGKKLALLVRVNIPAKGAVQVKLE